MFGLFKKKSDFDIYLDSGMPLVEHFYKYGVYVSNDILLQQNASALVDAYQKINPLYFSFNSYIIADKNTQSLTLPSDRERIVHFLMYINSFAYGLQPQRLNEKALRHLIVDESEAIFSDAMKFNISSQGFHRKVFKILEEVHDELNPSPIGKFFR